MNTVTIESLKAKLLTALRIGEQGRVILISDGFLDQMRQTVECFAGALGGDFDAGLVNSELVEGIVDSYNSCNIMGRLENDVMMPTEEDRFKIHLKLAAAVAKTVQIEAFMVMKALYLALLETRSFVVPHELYETFLENIEQFKKQQEGLPTITESNGKHEIHDVSGKFFFRIETENLVHWSICRFDSDTSPADAIDFMVSEAYVRVEGKSEATKNTYVKLSVLLGGSNRQALMDEITKYVA